MWRATAAIAASGEKRATNATDAPAMSGASTLPKMPSEWASGRAASDTSSGLRSITGPIHEPSAQPVAPCESSTPFGTPVEPEV